ncbi:MAG: ATP-binding protein [Cyanobacteria bacterium J06648_1]
MLFFTQYIPHGHCYLWQTGLVWLHVSADLLIACAYFSIPITLFYFVRKQRDNPLEKIIILFSLFIFSCGTTHLMSVWTLWFPNYWIEGAIKAFTALVSIYTAIELIEFFPYALSLSEPQALEQANQSLLSEIQSRNQAESELEKERSFLKAVLEGISDGVVACDERGILALFNPASQKLFGIQKPIGAENWAEEYGLCDAEGKNYLPPPDIPLSKAFAGETFVDTEIVVKTTGNTPRQLICNGCPILDADGGKLGAVVTVRDVTRETEAKQELKRSNAELLQSNRELEQFAYVASHDLREPLRMVISFTQLLAQRYREQLDDDADQIIAFAVDGAKRMETLIEDLLLFSRLNKQNKAFELVNCNGIIADALNNLQVSIQESNAKITVAQLPLVMGDEVQLAQLFQNLIKNAIVYCEHERPEIAIAVEQIDHGWQFSIEDNGIGIDPNNAERIFEVFQRLHAKEKYSGTGIGLSICKKIVERHGGKTWVESALGAGSIFKFTLNA